MPIAGTDAVVGRDFIAFASWFRFWAEIEAHCFPCVAALRVKAQTGSRLVAAMDHAVLAAAVLRDAVDDAILFPLHFLEQLRVARIMRVGHQIAGAFPAADVSRW